MKKELTQTYTDIDKPSKWSENNPISQFKRILLIFPIWTSLWS